MLTRHVGIPAEGAEINAYVAYPDGAGPWPAIILIHEIWGLVPHIEDVARRFAGAGYVALAPDLYSRSGLPVTPEEIGRAMVPAPSTGPQTPGPGLGAPPRPRRPAGPLRVPRLPTQAFMQTVPVAERADPQSVGRRAAELPADAREVVERALAWLQRQDRAQNVSDLQAVRHWLAAQADVDPRRIFSLGFCMGGGLSARLASSGAALSGCIIFYGEHPPVDEIANIRCPVLGLYGGDDRRITDGVSDLARAMAAAGKRFEWYVYEGAPHAFFNDSRAATYRPDAAGDAWDRVLAFLASAGQGAAS